MSFTAWAQSHARSILFFLAILVVAGVVASFSLPVALFPHVSFPRVRISLDAGDRPAERMAIEVTTPVEEAVRAIPGVRSVRSTTSRGTAEISVNFDWGEDMVAAMLQCQSQVNKILPALPAGTSFEVERMDPTVFPVIAYSLTSDSHSLVELRDLALYTLRPALSTVSGVARVTVQGGRVEEYRVDVDPDKLQSFKLTLAEVAAALSASNVQVAVGHLEQYNKLYLVVSDTRFQKFEEIERTVLRSTPDGVVLLEDVARVEHSSEPQWIRVTADGHDAVLFQVYQQPTGNTVEIASGIKAKLREMKKQIPDGVKIADWYDQSDLITASEYSTRDAVLIGIVLAAHRSARLSARLEGDIDRDAHGAGGARRHDSVALRPENELQHHDAGRHGGGGGADHRRRHRHGRTHRATLRAVRRKAIRVRRVLRAAQRIYQPAGRFLRGDHRHLHSARVSLSGVTGAFFKALSLTMAASLIISFLVAWLAVPFSARACCEGT